MSRSLVWTRAAADWSTDGPQLAGALPPGVNLVRIPCLLTETTAAHLPPGKTYDYLAFTSRNAVTYGMQVPGVAAAARAAKGIYTHGTETGAALTALGLAPIVAPARTAAELCAWVTAHVPGTGRFLIPSAAEPAFDLGAGLKALGHEADTLVCYHTVTGARTETGGPLPAGARDAFVATLSGVIAFASPTAVRGFATVLDPARNRLAGALTAVAIGPTTAAAAQAVFPKCLVAEGNTTSALIKAAVAAL